MHNVSGFTPKHNAPPPAAQSSAHDRQHAIRARSRHTAARLHFVQIQQKFTRFFRHATVFYCTGRISSKTAGQSEQHLSSEVRGARVQCQVRFFDAACSFTYLWCRRLLQAEKTGGAEVGLCECQQQPFQNRNQDRDQERSISHAY